METLGVITARCGSKGVNDKNIRQLNGKPLIAYTIENAVKSKYINEVMVSTDSDAYAAIAKDFGANVPFLRSNQNSVDTAASMKSWMNTKRGESSLTTLFCCSRPLRCVPVKI